MQTKHIAPALFVLSISAFACATVPEKNSALDAIRGSYRTAQSNPDVTKHAAVELQQAGQAIESAESAVSKRADSAEVEHLLYMAKQQVAIAQETGKLKAAEIAVASAGSERDQVRLELRTAEADAARKEVAVAKEAADRKAAEVAADNTLRETNKLRQAAASAEAATLAAAELEAANRKMSQMQKELADLNAKKTERGMVITLGDVLFDTNKAELKPGAEHNVQKIANFLQEYPERKAIIEGFTDNTGPEPYNQQLSERRAEAVRTFLIDKGIQRDRIAARGYGEAKPVASNDDPASRQRNRRVEIVLSDDNTDSASH
jgi:outer membrane protein OmpA-like peptidoglycan-associated protein